MIVARVLDEHWSALLELPRVPAAQPCAASGRCISRNTRGHRYHKPDMCIIRCQHNFCDMSRWRLFEASVAFKSEGPDEVGLRDRTAWRPSADLRNGSGRRLVHPLTKEVTTQSQAFSFSYLILPNTRNVEMSPTAWHHGIVSLKTQKIKMASLPDARSCSNGFNRLTPLCGMPMIARSAFERNYGHQARCWVSF